MKIIPNKGYILVSKQEIIPQKKGSLIIPGQENKKTYLRVESQGEMYNIGQCVLCPSYSTQMPIEENLFLIEEVDIVATISLEDDPKE